MPSSADIIKDYVTEFSRIQDWMVSVRTKNDMETYAMMHKRYIELKVTLSSLGVNLAPIDIIND